MAEQKKLMRTICIDINRNRNNEINCPYAVFERNTWGSRAVRNTSNFYIRNTMTGLQKSPEKRTHNETEVLHYVFTGIQEANVRKKRNLEKKLAEYAKAGRMDDEELVKKAYENAEPLPYPTAEKWMLSYEQLEAIFRCTKNPVYYNMASQVNQTAIKKTVDSWRSYFKNLKRWKAGHSENEGKPCMPGYIRTKETTAQFTNQVAKAVIKDDVLYLNFTGYGLYRIGPASILPGKLVKTEIMPRLGGYRILMTYEAGLEEPAVPEHPMRVVAFDPGVSNFLACVSSIRVTPFIIDGHWLKSINQWYNKERARLLSDLTKGEDSQHSKKDSRRLDALSRKRDDLIRDFFYKAAYYICRWCVWNKIEVIVIGHNKGQKQEINIGKENNQNFVTIPMGKFLTILKAVSCKYGIPVVVREESYTSQASLIDMDKIPTYGVDDDGPQHFSGKRVRRGLYRSADGTELNADVNSAGNIGRKEYPEAFAGKDFHFLAESVTVVRIGDLYPNAKKHPDIKGYKPKKSTATLTRHEERKQKRKSYTDFIETNEKALGLPPKKTKEDYIREAKEKKKAAA